MYLPGCGQNAGRICCGSAEGERINSVSCRILYRWCHCCPHCKCSRCFPGVYPWICYLQQPCQERMSGVKKSTLKTVGAVSAKCARQIAKGAAQLQELISVFLLPALQARMAEPVRLLLEPCLWVAAAMDIRLPGNIILPETEPRSSAAVASALVLLRECMMGEVEE